MDGLSNALGALSNSTTATTSSNALGALAAGRASSAEPSVAVAPDDTGGQSASVEPSFASLTRRWLRRPRKRELASPVQSIRILIDSPSASNR